MEVVVLGNACANSALTAGVVKEQCWKNVVWEIDSRIMVKKIIYTCKYQERGQVYILKKRVQQRDTELLDNIESVFGNNMKHIRATRSSSFVSLASRLSSRNAVIVA